MLSWDNFISFKLKKVQQLGKMFLAIFHKYFISAPPQSSLILVKIFLPSDFLRPDCSNTSCGLFLHQNVCMHIRYVCMLYTLYIYTYICISYILYIHMHTYTYIYTLYTVHKYTYTCVSQKNWLNYNFTSV